MNDNKPRWTDDQLKAISHRDGGAIVTAGAGSGKTAVLTTRVINMLCDKEHYINPSNLAIITFTKKAAAELKARLNRQMRERISENPANAEFLRKQSTLLHNAKISTISSFCFSLIKEHINLSTLASGFEIIEESRANMTRLAIAEMTVEEFYKTADEKDLALILEHFVHKNDNALIEAMLDVSRFASNLVEREEWLSSCAYNPALDEKLAEVEDASAKAEETLKDVFPVLKSYLSELMDLPEKKQETKQNKAAAICINAVLDFCPELNSYLEGNSDIFSLSDIPIPDNSEIGRKIPSCAKTNVGDKYSGALTLAVNTLKSINEYKAIKTSLLKKQPVLEVLVRLVKRFEELYAAEKQALNVADYSDAERQLYEMLKANPDLREKIGLELIVVDEFQDSNRLQYAIFDMLSDNRKNLYFVGDIKQSIYAFRGAQSEVFDEVTKNPDFTCLSLNHNFRSRDNVINSINEIFEPIMTEKLGGVNYKDNSRLILGDTKNVSTDEKDMTEVIAIYERAADAEPTYVAFRINSMIKSGYRVDGRPCKAEDFAIILRSDKDKASLYAERLSYYGISSTTKKGSGGFFAEPEITVMLDYLRVVDDPYNDECLARLLMSGLVGFSADKMAAIRTATVGFDVAALSKKCPTELKAYARYWQKKPLYTCLKAAVSGYTLDKEYYPEMCELYNKSPELFGSMTDNECIAFETELDRLRGVMAASSPAELIKCIYDTTSAADLLTVGENAATRRANLDTLLALAVDYGRYYSDSILSDFLSYIKDSDRQGCRPEFTANTASKGVQIMSIHASKGLEFPIVFVCDCAKTFNKDDTSKPVLTSDKYGVCVCDVNKALMAKMPSFAYKETAAEVDHNLRSEEMRLLYVAATRAKHKLIFTARPTKQQKDSSGYAARRLPDKQSATGLIAKNNYFSWLLVPYANDDTFVEDKAEAVVGSIRYRAVYSYDDEFDYENETVTEDALVDKAESDIIPQIAKQITEEYAYKPATEIAAKYTATNLAALKRRDSGERCELYVARPSFIRETDSKKLSGKRKGDAYHKLMEHIPFDKPLSETEAKDYIINCTADFLSDAERECINPSDISRFFNNDIAKRMLNSKKVYREFPIFHRLSDSILSQVVENYQQTENDSTYVQGIADMFFIEDDGIVLIDYKTDSFSDEEKLTEDYSFQLLVYAEALCKAFSMPVKEMYIYSFQRSVMVKI